MVETQTAQAWARAGAGSRARSAAGLSFYEYEARKFDCNVGSRGGGGTYGNGMTVAADETVATEEVEETEVVNACPCLDLDLWGEGVSVGREHNERREGGRQSDEGKRR